MARKWRLKSGLIIFLLFIVSLGSWWQWVNIPCSATGKTEQISIEPGSTLHLVAKELEQRKLIRSASAFSLMARTSGQNFRLLPGEYHISATMSPESILYKLRQGPDVQPNRVTIPEGYTSEQIVNLLVQKSLGTKESFIEVIVNEYFPYSFLNSTPAGIHRLEGFLFPDTYYFNQGDNARQIINTMLERFNCELTPETKKQLDNLRISVQEWVIMGSLVEREAEKEVDRSLIASVFFNRLKKDMPLQSCATIQFILGTPKAKLVNSDLQIFSPYNTYIHKGLPPGPIASPGHASLQAVIQHVQTDYLYFLAKDDGYHVFAKTFEEHLSNQKLYQ
ncbi:MAG: endolytic transglycosylase MltG [Desulfitobacteriaceae bacterium]|nr:endolytic transglycosylase MltG [Desulfitobacteriaceae bacterium]MDD4345853.1 endolytic transglycosylase MltG [Desulfitobacteriaceae bacterium]